MADSDRMARLSTNPHDENSSRRLNDCPSVGGVLTPPKRNQQSMGRRVAILQSNYIPWKGYFDLIHDVDLFVFYDDVQYTTRDWRNRNKIKTPNGPIWLTVPVGSDRNRLVCDVRIADTRWAQRHWKSLQQF